MPLTHATHKEENEVPLILIELGADVHQFNVDGLHALLHPLHVAAETNDVDAVRLPEN